MTPLLISRALPPFFVVIWATGFIVARSVVPYAEPMTFVFLRFALAGILLTFMAAAAGASWPSTPRAWAETVATGLLLQAVYVGGVFWAVSRGLPAGVSALIAASQPLLTATVSGPLLGEAVGRRRWLGIVLGFSGTALVLAPKLGAAEGYSLAATLAAIASVLAITAGSILHKRWGTQADLRVGPAIHFGASAVLIGLIAAATETGRIEPAPAFWASLLWAVLGLSVGAGVILLFLLRRGAVVGVASLFFLVPPVTSLMSFALFGETLTPMQLAGMAVATLGVALATRP